MKTSNQVEQIIIRRSNPDYFTCNKVGHRANNTYNLGTYYSRQWFFDETKTSNKKIQIYE